MTWVIRALAFATVAYSFNNIRAVLDPAGGERRGDFTLQR
jgi:hypothetical protein